MTQPTSMLRTNLEALLMEAKMAETTIRAISRACHGSDKTMWEAVADTHKDYITSIKSILEINAEQK